MKVQDSVSNHAITVLVERVAHNLTAKFAQSTPIALLPMSALRKPARLVVARLSLVLHAQTKTSAKIAAT